MESTSTADAAARPTPAGVESSSTSEKGRFKRRFAILFFGLVLVLYAVFAFGLYTLFAFLF